jgi:hypothetical protein
VRHPHTLLLHCWYTVGTLLSHGCYSVVARLLHSCSFLFYNYHIALTLLRAPGQAGAVTARCQCGASCEQYDDCCGDYITECIMRASIAAMQSPYSLG